MKIGGSARGGGGFWAEAVTDAGVEDLSLTTKQYIGPYPHQALVFLVTGPDGEPVPSGTVEVRFVGETETWSNDLVVEDGRATMDFWGLVGTVTAVAHGAGTFSGRRLPLGSARVGPLPLEEGELTIRLPAEWAISGVVRDQNGGPVAGVRLSVLPGDAEELEFEQEHSVSRSDERGAFRLGGLGDGEYLITAETPTGFLPVPPVAARAGTTGLSIALSRGAIARIRIVDPDGAPLVGAYVRAEDPTNEDERSFDGYSGRDGMVVLEGLEPERPYAIKITPPPDPRPLLTVKKNGFTAADTVITVPTGVMVGGVVVFPDDSPAPSVMVDCSPEGGGHEWGLTARDGSFRFGPYAAGSVRLWVRDTRRKAEPVEVTAGREDVRLTYQAGARLTVRILDWSDAYGPVRARLSGFGTRWAVVTKAGTATFTDLPEGRTFSLWVGPVGDGLYVLLRDLTPSDTPKEVRLSRGGLITGRLVLPKGARDAGVRVSAEGVSLTGLVDEGGSFRISGIPHGSCVVVAWAKLGRKRIESHLWARTGDSVTLEIR